eukprot:TRINITY_DN48824_c0_g1_i1.p1 TRINITY_DN48824_c0_g1~~TRINITY_DN48824_c0_g1_i1.p1  ORF type:complete len:576 (+),score=89.72 TRINITY_DN48824_c0_g1_i1:36-1730(+)
MAHPLPSGSTLEAMRSAVASGLGGTGAHGVGGSRRRPSLGAAGGCGGDVPTGASFLSAHGSAASGSAAAAAPSFPSTTNFNSGGSTAAAARALVQDLACSPRRQGPGFSEAVPIGENGVPAPRSPPEKTLGEFSELAHNYGNYRPARMGLRNALQAGKMRNPLKMQQSTAPWSARRPASANSNISRPGSRAQSAGRTRQTASPQHPTSPHGQTYPIPGVAFVGMTGNEKGFGMLQPQRIELPAYLNTPQRRPDAAPILPENRTAAIGKIQDLELLSFACKRAGKVREEGRAHFSLGVLRDNIGQHQKAIKCYDKFLKICKDCNDTQGCALAYHCIAVDLQLLGSAGEGGSVAGLVAATERISSLESPLESGAVEAVNAADVASRRVNADQLRKSIFYHNKHRENSDSVGKFVAHLNMGLVYSLLGEKEASTVSHQYALRYALQLHSLEGQTLAIGSLGFSAGMYDNDPERMQTLIERYIDLCGTLKQTRNQVPALRKLGILAGQQGDSEQSVSYFKQAIEVARAQGDHEAEKECSVRLGVVAGQAKMSEHLGHILQKSVIAAGR